MVVSFCACLSARNSRSVDSVGEPLGMTFEIQTVSKLMASFRFWMDSEMRPTSAMESDGARLNSKKAAIFLLNIEQKHHIIRQKSSKMFKV